MVLKVSQRGAIPPFIVMDVMQAAAEREAEGKATYHLEVGQPGTRARQGSSRRHTARWKASVSAIPSRSAFRNCVR